MSVWTTPATFVTGAVTAASMNAEIRDHANFLKGALDLITASTTADTGTATEIAITRTASTDTGYRVLVSGDSVSRYLVTAAGDVQWGAGGASTRDWRLRRLSGTEFIFDANGAAHQSGLFIESTAGQRSFVAARVNGDASSRTVLYGDATLTGLELGDGSSRDVNLYRSAANILKTDDQFAATDGITTRIVAGAVSDASFTVTPAIGTIAIDTTNLRIYIKTAAATWKSVLTA